MEHRIQNKKQDVECGKKNAPRSVFRVPCSTKRGAFLLELLIVIALLGIILGVGTQAVYVSLQSGKTAGERDVAVGLASEALEAVRGITEENWQGLYNLTENTQYDTIQSGSKWVTTTTITPIALNNASYTRSFIVQNVCRDTASTRSITGITDTNGTTTTCVASTGEFDPSTQKVTITVSWTGADPVTISEYFVRWKNKTCAQTNWIGGATTPTDNAVVVANCISSTVYFSSDNTIATSTAGQLELK